jgi:hypothetical protein
MILKEKSLMLSVLAQAMSFETCYDSAGPDGKLL